MMAARHHGMLVFCLAAAMLHEVTAVGTIRLDPPLLEKNGQKITVTWSGIPVVGDDSDPNNQMKADTIALVQTDAPFGARWPLKYIWVSQTASATYRSGSGTATFWVVNHRQDLQFLYLRYPSINVGFGQDFAWGNQQILARATLRIHPGLAKAPSQLRLSLLGFHPQGDYASDVNAKQLHYRADDDDKNNYKGPEYDKPEHKTGPSDDYPYHGPYNEGPFNPYGRDVQITWESTIPSGIAVISRSQDELMSFKHWLQEDYRSSAQLQTVLESRRSVTVKHASADTYEPEDMCGFPANSTGWLDPGFINSAVWKGLQHNQRYFYFVGSARSGFSSVRSFVTPPLAVSDCYKGSYDGQLECDGVSCNRECLAGVAPVRILLAADIGTNNHLDGTWSADGQGFYAINGAQSFGYKNVTGVPGPIWPRRSFGVYVELYNITLPVPYANLFYSLYAVADFPAWGQQPATYHVAEAINAQARSGKYHTAFMVGDLAYAEGMSAHWDMFLTDFEQTFSTLPTMFSNGNHESADRSLPEDGLPPDPESVVPDSGGECGIVYEKRMRMPTPPNIPASKRPEYYSYVMGPVAVIVLSTEQKWGPGSIQYTWLVEEFDKFARLRALGKLPWLVIAFHRPMYVDDPDISEGLGNQWVASQLLVDLEPLFAKYQVDMTWTGHTHFYHRSCPAFKGGCPAPVAGKGGHTISPPVHIMVGNGGFQPGASVFNETPAWIDVESFNYGYCTVEASQTQMTLQCFEAVNGTKFDSTTLYKPAGWRPSQEDAEKYHASLSAVPHPPGVNITAELGPTITWLQENVANLTTWALANKNKLEDLAFALVTYFEDSSVNGKLMNAVPGSQLYTMGQVSPIYFATMLLLAELDYALPADLKVPAIEEIDYILNINLPADRNTPGGRLWNMVNGVVPKR